MPQHPQHTPRPRDTLTDRMAMERQRGRFTHIKLTLRECAALLEFERSFDKPPREGGKGPGWNYLVAQMQVLIDAYPEEHPRRGFWSLRMRMSLY